MQRTIYDRERRADLVADLISLSTALVQLELHDEPAPGDPSLCEEFVERLLTRRLSNNGLHGHRLHLYACEPEAMSDAERQAVEEFGAPFLAAAKPLIFWADALRAASDVYRCETVGRTAAGRAFASERLHEALACTVAALAGLIGAHVTGTVHFVSDEMQFPPFLIGDALIAAEVEHAVAVAPRFTSPPPGAV